MTCFYILGTNIVKLIMLQELSKAMDIKLTDKTPFIPENFVKELYIVSL